MDAGNTELQTFLPYPSFTHSLAVLDRARLGKQRLECDQILTTLQRNAEGRPGGWSNHPAVRMWAGYEAALGAYMTLCCWEWEARGYAQNMRTPYCRERLLAADYWRNKFMSSEMREAPLPPWLGDEALHASHRARLLAKMPQHYEQFGWSEAPRSEAEGYIWPVQKDLG